MEEEGEPPPSLLDILRANQPVLKSVLLRAASARPQLPETDADWAAWLHLAGSDDAGVGRAVLRAAQQALEMCVDGSASAGCRAALKLLQGCRSVRECGAACWLLTSLLPLVVEPQQLHAAFPPPLLSELLGASTAAEQEAKRKTGLLVIPTPQRAACTWWGRTVSALLLQVYIASQQAAGPSSNEDVEELLSKARLVACLGPTDSVPAQLSTFDGVLGPSVRALYAFHTDPELATVALKLSGQSDIRAQLPPAVIELIVNDHSAAGAQPSACERLLNSISAADEEVGDDH